MITIEVQTFLQFVVTSMTRATNDDGETTGLWIASNSGSMYLTKETIEAMHEELNK